MSLKYGLMVAGIAASVAATEADAQVQTISGKFQINIYQGDGGGLITSPGVQADEDNPLITGANLLDTVTYDGALDFDYRSDPSNTIGEFFATGSGTVSGLDSSIAARTLSSAPFAITTVMDITFSASAIANGNFLHDDGVALYVNGTLVTPPTAAAPTAPANAPFASTQGGAYRLIYVSTNGLPQVLTVTGSPAPADFVDFACRIDLAQTGVAEQFKIELPATGSEKFCPENFGGKLRLDCSGNIPNYEDALPIVATGSVVCRISGSQCGLQGEFEAEVRSITISSSGFAELSCETDLSR